MLARATAGASGQPAEDDAVRAYQTELEVTGERQLYVGDIHVWRWYRGTGVGPYPCLSALQALERVCDHMVDSGVSLRSLVQVLLDGCENLAMVGLVVGLLVRHLEEADRLLDPYLAEPLIWDYEFSRVINEGSGFAANSEGIVAPERRNLVAKRGRNVLGPSGHRRTRRNAARGWGDAYCQCRPAHQLNS